jgi:ADP-heptose:LPS heptosyltransferase
VECTLDVLRNIGIDGNEKALYVPLSERGECFADRFMKEYALGKEILVALHPGSRQPRMRWNIKGFARVADTLIRENGVKVVMIQGPGEDALIGDILSMMQEKAPATPPEMTITELISLLNRCSLFIGNSTGPMHLAAGVKVPVVALFGNTRFMDSSEKWAPWGENHVAIDLPLNSFETCGKEVLGVEEVLTAARRLIDRKKGHSSSSAP